MSELDFLSDFSDCTEFLLSSFSEEMKHASETDAEFSLRLFPVVEQLQSLIPKLMECSRIFSLSVHYNIQDSKGDASLSSDGLITTDWGKDESLTPPEIDIQALNEYQSLANQLSQSEQKIEIEELALSLNRLKQAGALVELELMISLDKNALVKRLSTLDTIRPIIYVQSKKLIDYFQINNLVKVCNLMTPSGEKMIVFLLGDVQGIADGLNIKILGRDHWNQADTVFAAQALNSLGQDRIAASTGFLREESSWENLPTTLTPYHLDFSATKLNDAKLLDDLVRFRNDLSILSLANRVTVIEGVIKCEFKGYKSVWLDFHELNSDLDSAIYKLYNWVFENPSSDKLGIVRQIVTLQLGDAATNNRLALLEKAKDILDTSKSNFQVYLRRSVELYFDKRLKVSEFLQKFGESVGAHVKDMVSDLSGNLYKTIGVILGDVVAIILDPKYTATVVLYTSLLYFLYIISVFFLQSATYWKYINEIKEYDHNVDHLNDILTKEEIAKLEGDLFSRSKNMFVVVFAITSVVYALLAVVAFLIFSNLKSLV